MTYPVALDDKNQKQKKDSMAATWMHAAGLDSVPMVFIVNQQGRVAWIGHPKKLNRKILSDIFSGDYDLAEAVMKILPTTRQLPFGFHNFASSPACD